MSESSNETAAFRLYVVAEKLTTPRTIQGVRDALTALLGEAAYQLEVFDVITNPRSAFEGQIKATPTLVRIHPLPEVRIIGDMAKPELLAQVMGDIRRHRLNDSLSRSQ